ncbi:toll/interleukin-1 receptor domain-containing protein [Pseudoalteromonas sp. J010]|uniref:toll/interleukin-1 receptor domain-containing protein n=1 Tax=Pseudoalteromonas sp. J010 TaxID=998465 RepID=UPI000F64BC22|nr:toll/interleukin-1 receptor domain-containing protein [Pseudoalteromonas sp. J010]RRS08605.1 toll/interleukin-1 receptor domain-containing protein [Pseudoalteromonas sp. J010]
MVHDYMYVFECDYGDRVKERAFIKDILRNFDKNYATMVGIVVNNNPYCLSFHVAVNLQDNPVKFESWLRSNYPDKIKRHNIFLSDTLSYNIVTFIDEATVDLFLTKEGGGAPFLWPEQEYFEEKNPQYVCMKKNESRVFISHSSKDKELIVNPLNSYLQANEIATWLDSYEIDYGDNIYLKVNEGIENSDVGLFVLTDNFFDSASGWPLSEFSTFFMELMKSNKKVLMINAGVSPDKMHAMMKSYKYLTWENSSALPEIANAVKRVLNN